MRGLILFAHVCAMHTAVAQTQTEALEKLEFVGSTPCELRTEQFLGIVRRNSPDDKITWQLTFFSDQQQLHKTFKLMATYGIQAQSAPGFAEGAKTVEFTGSWEIRKGSKANPNAVVFRINADKTGKSVSFAKISDHVLHFLNEDGSLMRGDDLWSYTLNRKGTGRND